MTREEAEKLLRKFYTKISLDSISSLRDNGDGSHSPIFDIIDGDTLIKVRDYMDPEYPDPDYEENEYTEASTRCWGKNKTAIEVDDLIDVILQDILSKKET